MFCSQWPMPKEINPRRKWKRVILCFDYICLNIYLFGGMDSRKYLTPVCQKTLRIVEATELQGTELEICGLTSGPIPDFELLPPTHPPWKYV